MEATPNYTKSDSQQHFATGQSVVIRHIYKRKILSVLPAIVACDNETIIALYIQIGTRWKVPVNKDHQRVSLLAHEWMLEDSIWIENNALELIIPGAAHAIFLIWRGTDHQLVNWYVNFQEPIRRSPYGFDSLDYELDIVVTPDGQRWKWKDKELFQELVKRHIFSQEEASAIWNEAYAVLSLLEDQKHPLIGSSWQEWMPDAHWSIPTLLPGWHKVEG